jgi:hypothetical protein
MVEKSNIPSEVKELLRHELPEVMERIEDATKQIYDPASIWLESLQFADYVGQLGKHLQECNAEECIPAMAVQLLEMADGWKEMAENAMQVLDISEGEFKHGTL